VPSILLFRIVILILLTEDATHHDVQHVEADDADDPDRPQ
jgi:hypothetical protein